MTKKSSSLTYASLFALAILLGILNGLYSTSIGNITAHFFSEIFVHLFKFISVPIIGVTICLTIASLGNGTTQRILWKRTLFYTLSTTLAAATVAAGLFYGLHPANIVSVPFSSEKIPLQKGYLDYFISVIPDNPLAPFVQGNVLSILLIALVTGLAIRVIEKEEYKQSIIHVLGAIQSILFFMVKWIIRLLPLGIFGFTSLCVKEFLQHFELNGLGVYLIAVIGANLIQGLVVLPLFLLIRRLNPWKTFVHMSKALLVAFFSKSSAGTLPITLACAEQNNHIQPNVSRFVLPICTTINMNGCAAFILVTVMYLMQNNGTPITLPLLGVWIVVATIAAIGNAGVPMGCFFLAASLLSSMNVPIHLLGIILPFYAVLDMLETALNVWSDSCVATLVNKDLQNTASSKS